MNLKELNEYVGHVHFEMDTLKDVRCDTLNPKVVISGLLTSQMLIFQSM